MDLFEQGISSYKYLQGKAKVMIWCNSINIPGAHGLFFSNVKLKNKNVLTSFNKTVKYVEGTFMGIGPWPFMGCDGREGIHNGGLTIFSTLTSNAWERKKLYFILMRFDGSISRRVVQLFKKKLKKKIKGKKRGKWRFQLAIISNFLTSCFSAMVFPVGVSPPLAQIEFKNPTAQKPWKEIASWSMEKSRPDFYFND